MAQDCGNHVMLSCGEEWSGYCSIDKTCISPIRYFPIVASFLSVKHHLVSISLLPSLVIFFGAFVSFGISKRLFARMPPKVLSHSTENHIVPVKPWNIWLRVAQFALAVIILIFVAVPTHYWGGYDAFGVSLFTSIATFIIVPYYVVTASISTKFYNRWAVLGLDILGVVFWLVSFSLLADWAANSHYSYYYDYYWWKKRDLSLAKRTNSYSASRDLAATAAALGAVELYVQVLVVLA